jgi:hypothetical protein
MLRYIPWGALVLGLWLIAAPYVLGFAAVSTALVNSLAVGAILTIASCICLYYLYVGAGAGQQTSPQKA